MSTNEPKTQAEAQAERMIERQRACLSAILRAPQGPQRTRKLASFCINKPRCI